MCTFLRRNVCVSLTVQLFGTLLKWCSSTYRSDEYTQNKDVVTLTIKRDTHTMVLIHIDMVIAVRNYGYCKF